MSSMYNDAFYQNRNTRTREPARRITGFVLELVPGIGSAVDFGCGVGAWLAALRDQGVAEVFGMDGPWVNQAYLEIRPEEFRATTLDGDIRLDRRYDLAVSLEVAEHLPAAAAPGFVDNLVRAADVVLFSAAIPGQGGIGHVNEQWPAYWARLFAERGYRCYDVIRPRFWADDDIPYWYRQNALLFVRDGAGLPRDALDAATRWGPGEPPALVHPTLLTACRRREASLKHSWRTFRRNLKQRLWGGKP